VGPTQAGITSYILATLATCPCPRYAPSNRFFMSAGDPDQARSRNACLAFPGRSVPT